MSKSNEPYQPLDLSKATVLVTGGSSGIGLGLAEEFLKAGSTVIVTGRRESALKEAQQKSPDLITYVNDVSKVEEREKLAKWVVESHPKLNILVNNAGIMRRVALAEDHDWATRQSEIDINISAPVHLANLLTPHLLKQPEGAIINVTSGLGLVPCAFAPTYGGTKAFLHSWTQAVRPHYEKSKVQIIEIIPPAVKTNLGGGMEYGDPLDEFIASVFGRFTKGEKEIGYKSSEDRRFFSKKEREDFFDMQTKNIFTGKYKQYESEA